MTPRIAHAPEVEFGQPAAQYAALPWRLAEGGSVEVMLVTSRETKRWVVPKGWPMDDLEPWDAAAREALEEAGVEGEVEAWPLGCYRYDKRLKRGNTRLCEVQLFALRVERERKKWPEKSQRTRQWFTVEAAADAVHEPDLAALIRAFGARD